MKARLRSVHLDLPSNQNHLIEEIVKVQPNTAWYYIMDHYLMPWADKVKAILEVYLGGQAVGEATVNLCQPCKSSGNLQKHSPTIAG